MVTLAQLKGQDLIVWTQIPWLPLFKAVPVRERHLYRPRHWFNEIEPLKQALKVEAGVAILPERLCATKWPGANRRRCRLKTDDTPCRWRPSTGDATNCRPPATIHRIPETAEAGGTL